jgi:nitroreductase
VTALYCITWAVIAGVAAWAVTTTRACAAIARLRAQMRADIGYWQDETSRARAHAAQIARDTAIWADAWKEGRDDAIAIMPLIIAARSPGSGTQDAAGEESGTR